MSTQAECIKVVQTETTELKQYLAALPEDAWTKPSTCALWAVRDVVAHMIAVVNGYRDNIVRGLQDDISTPEGLPEPQAYKTATHEERQQIATTKAQRGIALSERLGSDLLSGFNHACDQFNQLVARLTPHEWKVRFQPEVESRQRQVLDQLQGRNLQTANAAS